MVTTDVIISAMNAFDDANKGDQEQADVGQSGTEASTAATEEPESNEEALGQSTTGAAVGLSDKVEDCPELVPQEEDDSDDKADSDDEEELENDGTQEAAAEVVEI